MRKKVFYTELAYVCAMLLLALGNALTERADFGISMVIAPSYLLHLKISQFLPWFSFGVAEYCMQSFILLLTILLLGKLKLAFFFCFVSAMLSGVLLDAAIALIALLPSEGFGARLVYYVIGVFIATVGVALMFRSYVTPGAYETFVKELAPHFGIGIGKFKTGYDVVSLIISVTLSFCFFGLWQFEGIKLGTVICAAVNGTLIGMNSKLLEQHFEFRDAIPRLGSFFRTL